MALAFSSPAFWWSLGIVIFGLYYFARIINVRWRPALWLRWGVAGLVVLGIFATRADWRIDPLPTRQVLLVDISHSIAEEEMINMQEKVENWMNIDKNRIVVWIGANAQVNQQLDNLEIDQRASNLPAGLQLAIDILGDNPGIVTLASDGVTDNEFDTQQIVMRMQAEGHTLNVVSLNTLVRPNDLYLGDIQVPAGVWAQVSFEVDVLVYVPTAGTAFLDLAVDGEVLESRSVSVVPGENIVSFVLQASGEQILTIEARGTWQGDQFLDNNQSYAAIRVFSVPKVLLVSKIGLSATNFDRALGNEGITVDRINPKNFPINLSQFEDYQVIVLNNVAVLDLNFEQVQALKVFVSKGEIGRAHV